MIKQFDTVAPFAGAWIEIFVIVVISVWTVSLPSRERGLKFVRGSGSNQHKKSLPSRERGLKFPGIAIYLSLITSLPSRERGLKSICYNSRSSFLRVAPFAGAWIEIRWKRRGRCLGRVAPFAGAWIEISLP